MSQSDRINVKQAAGILGISCRAVYSLAAPKGPIPCYRNGRTVRFDKRDIEEYDKSCRYVMTKETVDGALSLKKLSMADDSVSRNYFQKRGIALKPKHSTKKKPRGSTHLQLVLSKAKP
ncbi:MAG: helix-turn-helix domain-containing protein [Oxalobacter sp.]|nr:helix-turn-helix domain-containing protein [Oxalobacter sp.]